MLPRRARPPVLRRLVVIVAALTGLVGAGAASRSGPSSTPRTWYLTPEGDGDAPTIQAAVDSAGPGDVIILADGVYRGDGNFNVTFTSLDGSQPGDTVVVRSEHNDPSRCIVDADGNLRGFYLLHTDATTFVLAGVTVTNATRAVVTNPGYMSNAVELRDCVFSDIEKDGFAANGETHSTILRCRFERNGWDGIISRYSSTLTAIDCEFLDNDVGVTLSESVAQFVDCRFDGNTGGGMRIGGEGSVDLTRCEFLSNSSPRGGAIQCVNGRVQAVDCLFKANVATIEGGGVYVDSGYPAMFDGCLFVGNSADGGAAVFATNAGDVELTRCTLVGNTAATGSAITCERSDEFSLERTAVVFNSGGPAVDCDAFSNVEISCTDVFGNPGGDWTGAIAGRDIINGNLSADPLFCDPAAGDFHVTSDSPCLDSGCSTIGAFGQGCETMHVALDIAPGSCPNNFSLDQRTSINPHDAGDLISVCLLGASYFDAGGIDPASVTLEGLSPEFYDFDDNATAPLAGATCQCALPGGDGFDDLTLRFLKAPLARALSGVNAGRNVTLTVTGRMNDGTAFVADDCVTIVGRVALYNGVPNPFNPTTQIRYFLPRRTFVRLTVFDVLGRRVDELVSGEQPAGDHIVEWNASRQSSGIYFCQLDADGFRDARKVVLVK